MRVLVTGGAGYVGGFAARRLLRTGHDVCVLDNLSAGHRSALPAGILEVGDLADGTRLRELLRERDIEVVLHFAASAAVGESVRNPRLYYRNNVSNSLTLLEAMADAGVSRIVFSSTCAVYGESAASPLHEGLPTDPTNPYAFSKLAIERMIQDFHRAYGLAYVLLRYFNAAGASPDGLHGEDHDPETHLIPLAIRTMLGQRPALEVFGNDYPTPDGTCIRDYVHVEDLALAHELAAQWDGSGIFNLGTGTGTSVLEVLNALERVAGRPVPHRIVGRRAGDVPRLVARSERVRGELGWQVRQATIDEVVASAWNWHAGHPQGYGDPIPERR